MPVEYLPTGEIKLLTYVGRPGEGRSDQKFEDKWLEVRVVFANRVTVIAIKVPAPKATKVVDLVAFLTSHLPALANEALSDLNLSAWFVLLLEETTQIGKQKRARWHTMTTKNVQLYQQWFERNIIKGTFLVTKVEVHALTNDTAAMAELTSTFKACGMGGVIPKGFAKMYKCVGYYHEGLYCKLFACYDPEDITAEVVRQCLDTTDDLPTDYATDMYFPYMPKLRQKNIDKKAANEAGGASKLKEKKRQRPQKRRKGNTGQNTLAGDDEGAIGDEDGYDNDDGEPVEDEEDDDDNAATNTAPINLDLGLVMRPKRKRDDSDDGMDC